MMFAANSGLSNFPSNPLPSLTRLIRINKNNEMFTSRLDNFIFNFSRRIMERVAPLSSLVDLNGNDKGLSGATHVQASATWLGEHESQEKIARGGPGGGPDPLCRISWITLVLDVLECFEKMSAKTTYYLVFLMEID